MAEFNKQDYKDWLRHPVTLDILTELSQFRLEVFESILCTPRDARADVTFRVEGMDLILSRVKEKGE